MGMIEAIKVAYDKGYRVTEDGTLLGLKGNPLLIKKRGTQRYPTFSANVGSLTGSGVYGIPVHKFAAYCFYGEETFKDGIVVRHLDADTENVSKENIVLGTYSQNELDKPSEVRSRTGKIARASQPSRAHNSKFTDEEVREIRRRRDAGESGVDIGKDFGVTRNCIYLIHTRRNYADVK